MSVAHTAVAGLVGVVAGSIGDFVAFSLASQELVVAVGCAAVLLCNVAVSTVWHKGGCPPVRTDSEHCRHRGHGMDGLHGHHVCELPIFLLSLMCLGAAVCSQLR